MEAKPRKGGEPEEESRSSERSRASEDDPRPNGLNGADVDGADGKKERVLHTRVPAVLERELKRFADNLRIPVSNLVRTILEDALNVADAATENVESRLKKAAKQLEHERERLKARVKFDPLKDIFAFQDITLAQDATCAKCERDLAAGTRASLGLTDEQPNGSRKKPRIFVCDECLPGKR